MPVAVAVGSTQNVDIVWLNHVYECFCARKSALNKKNKEKLATLPA